MIVWSSVLLVFLGLFTSGLGGLVGRLPWFQSVDGAPSFLLELLFVIAFPSLLVGLWLYTRNSIERVRVHVIQNSNPSKAKALILFLSPIGIDLPNRPSDRPVIEQILASEQEIGVSEESVREQFNGSWRMPLEAIAYHFERLEQVVVIPSADSQARNGSTRPGTHHEMATFRALVEKLTASRRVECRSMAELIPELQQPSKPLENFASGTDFEDAEALVECVELAYDYLLQRNLPAYEVIVDITGGQKVPTVAGAAVALAEGRRFQYVSTVNYVLREYDVTYLQP